MLKILLFYVAIWNFAVYSDIRNVTTSAKIVEEAMNISKVIRIVCTVFAISFFSIAVTLASANIKAAETDKPPEIIQGGLWKDHFYNPQYVSGINFDVQMSRIFIKLDKSLHWIQTWTAHFASGEFFQTEAIADSARLEADGNGQYFVTGMYTSTVFYAGKPVDWSLTGWRYSGIPDGLVVEFRTGNSAIPDEGWSDWVRPSWSVFKSYCAYTYNSDETECLSNMSGVESNPYIQYRAGFNSNDPIKTIALYDIDFLYGTHAYTATALSILIPPVDLRDWENLTITSTIPASTTLVIDVLAPDGTVLVPDAHNGDSLASVDARQYPAIQLRASFTTSDQSRTPELDLWGSMVDFEENLFTHHHTVSKF